LADWNHFDLERRANYQVVVRDPAAFFRLNPRHVALDEAQLASEVFSALRVAIDERRGEKGRYAISGSSSPDHMRSVSESLARRVGIIELAPFSWAEATQTTKWDSWARQILERKAKAADLIDGLKPRDDIAKAHEFWFRGFPEPWLNPGGDFCRHWIEQYFQTYLYRDVKRLFPGLDEMRFRRFIEMLGGLSGRVLNYADIARALAVSQPTARDYFDIAHGTFRWRRIPAFSKDSMKRMVKHPRGYLRDSGLLHALLHTHDTDALLSHPKMGASWEGMVIEEVLRQLNSLGAAYEYSYYRATVGR
jgi:uncharacterized protein